MGLEIERRFLVRGAGWRGLGDAIPMRQGYLASGPPASVRIRTTGDEAWLAIKHGQAPRRTEYEIAFPVADAAELLESGALVGEVVEKTRHRIAHGGHVWDVDEFVGANADLVIAEIELDHQDEAFERPPWLGDEITHDSRYANSALALRPFSRWER